MRHVEPYRTESGLLKALDNGGRFFNIFTHAGDEQITRAELSKAAGAVGSTQKAMLFFAMAQVGLSDTARRRAVAALGPKASKDYAKYNPTELRPSAIDREGVASQGIVVEGVQRFLKDTSHFTGMMMLPISTGNTTTFMPVPLHEHYDIYELFDDRRMRRPSAAIATPRGLDLPAGARMRFAGVLKKMNAQRNEAPTHPVFLEASYYTRL